MKKIICIHAHFSNIHYLTELFQKEKTLALEHYVMTDFLDQITTDNLTNFIEKKIEENVVGVIITCTMYSNLIKQKLILNKPILRVEDPLIAHILANPHKKSLIFSNPKTVKETIKKIDIAYLEKNLALDYEVHIVPDAFDLILTNQKMAYQKALLNYLYLNNDGFSGDIYLMQLSMAIISKEQLTEFGFPIFTILDSLDAIVKQELLTR
ncbi:hypothetical protein [Enterococcus sp. AZ126]|uniref:hypothetical protein n=1 Tax=Enterococcus sp. AZ126 TaxID=2774635 RepID=UPI003F22C4EF